MQIYPEIRFGRDEINDRLVIDFGANRSSLGTLPLLLLLPAGFCLLQAILPSEKNGFWWTPLGIFLLALSLILTAMAQYYFTDRVIIDRKRHEIWQETRCGKYAREGFRISFDQVAGIGFKGKWIKTRYGTYLGFNTVLVSRTGIITPVSLEFREDKFKNYVEMARKISEFIGSEFVEPNIKLPRLVLEHSGGQHRITYRVSRPGQN